MISKIIKEDLVLKVKSKINQYNKFVITAHMSPDGDALGSSLGLYHFLTAEGKEATVVLNDSVADNLKWMPGMEHIVFYDSCPQQAIEKIEEAEVIFCVDFNQAKRMGTISEFILKSNAYKILVDHHLFPDDFCNIIISHPEISSASELVYRLVYQMDEANMISLDMATVIYTGMMTDTGAFTYNSNSPEIYQIISELLVIGINKDKIYDKVNNTFSADRERLMGFTINEKMKVFPQFGAAMISLTKQDLERYNYKKGDSEGFVNIPLAIKGIQFSVFFREENEYVKVSLRSKGDFPANKVAESYFNGGGHKNASGGEFFGTVEQAEALLEEILPKFVSFLED